MATEWVGTWEGGRIAKVDGEQIYYIEKKLGPRGATKRYTVRLGTISHDDAKVELSAFKRDPDAYRTPGQQNLAKHADAERLKREVEASAVVITDGLIESFITSVTKGEDRKARTEHHAEDLLRYVGEWAAGPLNGKDLRTVTLPELHKGLDSWTTARRKRVIALKSFTKFLRHRGALTTQNDPTLGLKTPQPKKPTLKEIKEKIYQPSHMEAVFAHVQDQNVRDVLRLRILTGAHVTELERIATGDATFEQNPYGGPIFGKVMFPHKSGHLHTQSVDAATYGALQRLAKNGVIPDYWEIDREISRAAKAASVEPIKVANLRATFITLARTKGHLEHVPGQNGIPLALVAQLVGHTNPATTTAYYDASEWPPMAVIPVKLKHASDPAPPKSKKTKKGA